MRDCEDGTDESDCKYLYYCIFDTLVVELLIKRKISAETTVHYNEILSLKMSKLGSFSRNLSFDKFISFFFFIIITWPSSSCIVLFIVVAFQVEMKGCNLQNSP